MIYLSTYLSTVKFKGIYLSTDLFKEANKERGAFLMPREYRKYSPEFKIEVIETKLKENLSQMETARRFNIYITIHDHQYPDNKRIAAWERIYLEEGKEGFYIERRGRGSKGKGNKKYLDPKVEEDLIAKCQRLEMENEYLKKLSALVSARERKEKK